MLSLRPAEECRWDCVSLGEVMLRLDPSGAVSGRPLVPGP